MRAKLSSLTIWKADINTGVYIVIGVSRVLLQRYKYQAVNLLLSGRFMVSKYSPRIFAQPDSFLFFKIMNYQLLFKTLRYFTIHGNI